MMDKIVALCKRRGFIFPGSEIYGGIQGFWDWGPLGVELKNNIKREWWKKIVYERDNIVGIDAAIIMNTRVWEASGHVEAFTDPLIICETCHKRFRPDQIGLKPVKNDKKIVAYSISDLPECPSGGHKLKVNFKQLIEVNQQKVIQPWQFNLLVQAEIGVVDKNNVYLRGEITQGAFVNFKNVLDSSRLKIPFGIAQIGKAFRNEITPGNFAFRSREFEQMELEYFVKPDEAESNKTFEYWKNERMKWYLSLGFNKDKLRFRKHEDNERAHYARSAEDIEYDAPFGWSEFEGIHHRGDWDLSKHNLKYKDPETQEEYTPWVIETSGGVDRAALFFLMDSFVEEEKRVVLKLHPKLAPYKIAVFPLLSNKPELVDKAKTLYNELRKKYRVIFDGRGNIGKRYFAQDEIGTPFCITVDFDTLEDDCITVRDRDTTKQDRVSISKLDEYLTNKLL